MTFRTFLSLAATLACLVSCNTGANPSGFLGSESALLRKNRTLPFQRSWIDPDADFSKYPAVAVVPMETKYLQSLGGTMDAANVRNFGNMHRDDSKELATYLTFGMQRRIEASTAKTAFISANPPKEKNLLVLESALVEAVPGRPSTEILNFFLPFIRLLNRPSIAIEGRVRDAESGETLLLFADRETPELSLLDARKFTFYKTQEREADRWAAQLQQILEGDGRKLKQDPFFIQPINW